MKKHRKMGQWKGNALIGIVMLVLAIYIWLNPNTLSTLREANMGFYKVVAYLYLAAMVLNIGCAIWVYFKDKSEWVVVRLEYVEGISDKTKVHKEK